MRLFTKLRAEEIQSIAIQAAQPAIVAVPAVAAVPASPGVVAVAAKPAVKAVPAVPETLVITTLHGTSHQFPKADILLSAEVAKRKDPAGPIVGDWFVADYDILGNKPIYKVFDKETFTRYFKASIGG
jgi:hypothetical protein